MQRFSRWQRWDSATWFISIATNCYMREFIHLGHYKTCQIQDWAESWIGQVKETKDSQRHNMRTDLFSLILRQYILRIAFSPLSHWYQTPWARKMLQVIKEQIAQQLKNEQFFKHIQMESSTAEFHYISFASNVTFSAISHGAFTKFYTGRCI